MPPEEGTRIFLSTKLKWLDKYRNRLALHSGGTAKGLHAHVVQLLGSAGYEIVPANKAVLLLQDHKKMKKSNDRFQTNTLDWLIENPTLKAKFADLVPKVPLIVLES